MTSSTMATWPAANNLRSARALLTANAPRTLRCRSSTPSDVCDGVSRTRRTARGAHRNLQHASRVARQRRGLVEAALAQRAACSGTGTSSRGSGAARRRAAWASSTPSTRALAMTPLVLEPADQLVDRMLDIAARPARAERRSASHGRSAWQTLAEIEIERRAREIRTGSSAAETAWRRAAARGPLGAVNLNTPPLVDNASRAAEHAREFRRAGASAPAGKLMQINS